MTGTTGSVFKCPSKVSLLIPTTVSLRQPATTSPKYPKSLLKGLLPRARLLQSPHRTAAQGALLRRTLEQAGAASTHTCACQSVAGTGSRASGSELWPLPPRHSPLVEPWTGIPVHSLVKGTRKATGAAVRASVLTRVNNEDSRGEPRVPSSLWSNAQSHVKELSAYRAHASSAALPSRPRGPGPAQQAEEQQAARLRAGATTAQEGPLLPPGTVPQSSIRTRC